MRHARSQRMPGLQRCLTSMPRMHTRHWDFPGAGPRPGPRQAVFLVTVRDTTPVAGGTRVAGQEAGRPWKADHGSCLPLAAVAVTRTGGPVGAWPFGGPAF